MRAAKSALERPVLYFNAHGSAITRVTQNGKEVSPIHISQAGQLRCVEFKRMRHDADFVEAIPVQTNVLRMHVKNAVGEITQRTDLVHVLPNHVRGVVVESEVRVGDFLEHAAPDGWSRGQVLPSRPFVGAEGHGAVLNGDAHALIFGELDKRLPHLQKARPVFLDRAASSRAR